MFFLTGAPLKVLSVRFHSKFHQKSSMCQNLLTEKNLWFLGGHQLKKNPLYKLTKIWLEIFGLKSSHFRSQPFHLLCCAFGKVCNVFRWNQISRENYHFLSSLLWRVWFFCLKPAQCSIMADTKKQHHIWYLGSSII